MFGTRCGHLEEFWECLFLLLSMDEWDERVGSEGSVDGRVYNAEQNKY